jgi:hypothetical protein
MLADCVNVLRLFYGPIFAEDIAEVTQVADLICCVSSTPWSVTGLIAA